jgi:hypothetical protein
LFFSATKTGEMRPKNQGESAMKFIFEKLNRFFNGLWNIAVLDMKKGRWILEPEPRFISYLKAENANGRHILIRPGQEIESYYLIVDDLDRPLLARHHKYPDGTWKPGRMVIETSPENFQVWIHSDRSLELDEKRYWLKKLRNDPGADPNNRWGRCPGFRNRKDKYRNSGGEYPLARLIWIDWRRKTLIPAPDLNSSNHPSSPFSPQPHVGVVCHKNISRTDYIRDDDSTTDFSYALALARRNFTDIEIRNRILSERENWENHKGERRLNAYIDRTIVKARAIVQNS